MSALKSLDLKVARKAFIRIREMRYLELVSVMENRLKLAAGDDDAVSKAKGLCEAQILAWR